MAEDRETLLREGGALAKLLGKLCNCEAKGFGKQQKNYKKLSPTEKGLVLTMQDVIEHMGVPVDPPNRGNKHCVELDEDWVQDNLHDPQAHRRALR